ncbi:MAG: hypothetical protein ACRDLK_08270, partial [Gaiellaceae bacterium]
AGCGGGGPATTGSAPPKLPRALARQWAQKADAVASATAAGHGCEAQQLASSLRDAVIGAEARVPARLRDTLVGSVNELADRISCTLPAQTVTEPAAKPKPKPPKHDHPPGHGHGHDHGPGHGGGH